MSARRALAGARHILILCHGNIIRSPFACRLLAARLAGPDAPVIESAGLEAITGSPAEPNAIAAAMTLGIDLRSHRATRMSDAHVDRTDVIFVMEASHVREVRRRFARAESKTFLLTALAPEGPLEIADPIFGNTHVFDCCFDDIERAVRAMTSARASVRIAS